MDFKSIKLGSSAPFVGQYIFQRFHKVHQAVKIYLWKYPGSISVCISPKRNTYFSIFLIKIFCFKFILNFFTGLNIPALPTERFSLFNFKAVGIDIEGNIIVKFQFLQIYQDIRGTLQHRKDFSLNNSYTES